MLTRGIGIGTADLRKVEQALEQTLLPAAVGVPAVVARLPRLAAIVRSASGFVGEWSAMAAVGAFDLTVARILEPHVDALAILDESQSAAHVDADTYTWGVYAAESAHKRLEARETSRGWRLRGDKPWCSLARDVDRALVTAWTAPQARRLFAIDLRDESVAVGDDPWVAHGLAAVDSPTITCHDTPATAVGEDGWYLNRPGFSAGGIRVAAIWYGAAVELGRALRAASDRRSVDQIAMMHLGAAESALHRARCVLADAAERFSCASAFAEAAAVALHARSAVRDAAEEVLERSAHALGPGPLVRDRHHADRVADLTVYLRQEHAERDHAALGSAVRDGRGLIL